VRHLILVILLVAAAFLGGAFVNGPGLQWVQARIMKSLGLGEASEITSVQFQTSSDPSKTPSPSKTPQLPTLPPAPTVLADQSPAPKAQPKRLDTTNQSCLLKESGTLRNPTAHQPTDHLVRAISLKNLSQSAQTSGTSTNAPDPFPLAQSPGKVDSTWPTSRATVSSQSGANDWAILWEELQAQGVTRFKAESDANQRVTFSCLIPIAGRQAVSQQFEANDISLLKAAQTTLKRILLWKAAHEAH